MSQQKLKLADVNTSTGTGAFVFATSPALVTPNIGVAVATTLSVGGGTIGTRAFLVSGNISGGVATIERTNSSTTAVIGTSIIKGTSTGVAATGFGTAFQFALQDSGTAETLTGNIQSVLTSANLSTTPSASLAFTVLNAGNLLVPVQIGSTGSLGLGLAGSLTGNITFFGTTSGSILLQGVATASGTNTLQAVTDTFVYRATTDTLTNKRITKRVLALSANSATPAINTDSYDVVHITAQTAAITSFTSSLTGTPVDGDTLRISITGTTAVALTWGTSFEASGGTALPTTTVTTARLDVGFFWNTETSKWRCEGSS